MEAVAADLCLESLREQGWVHFIYHEESLQKVEKVHVVVDEPLWGRSDFKDVKRVGFVSNATLVFKCFLDDGSDGD